MSNDKDGRVRERAYHLWREAGSEHGREMDHWLQAEREEAAPQAKTAKRDGGDADAPPKAKAAGAKAPSKDAASKTAPAAAPAKAASAGGAKRTSKTSAAKTPA